MSLCASSRIITGSRRYLPCFLTMPPKRKASSSKRAANSPDLSELPDTDIPETKAKKQKTAKDTSNGQPTNTVLPVSYTP